MTLYLVEMQVGTTASPTVEIRRYASGQGFVTTPADDPADAVFLPRLLEPANFERAIFSRGTTRGRSTVARGPLVLANADGALDDLTDLGVEGYSVTLYTLADRFQAWSSRVTVGTFVMEQLEWDWRTVTLRLRDRLALLDRPLQPAKFAGTSTGSTGIEGGEELEAKPKPMVFGQVFEIEPVPANAQNEIWAINHDIDGATVEIDSWDAVYSAGADYTLSGTDRADLAALEASTPPASEADTCLAEGLLRTNGFSAQGVLTADVTEGATAADRTAAQVASRILARHGYTIDSASLTALDAANAAVVGLYAAEEASILGAAQRVLDSVGGYLVTDRAGTFKVGRFEPPEEAPSGTPALDIVRDMIVTSADGGIERVPTTDDDFSVPAWKVVLGYRPFWTVQRRGELAGSVGEARAADLRRQFRTVEASDATVREVHPEAREIYFETLLADRSAALAEAARRLALYSVRRDRYIVRLKAEDAVGVDLGDLVSLTLARFGLDAGRQFRVIGITELAAIGVTELDIWG